MNNIKNNLLSVVKTLAVFVVIGFSVGKAQGVFITEIADPNTNADATAGGRFVELYNNTESDVDLTGWALRRWTNANTDPQADKALQGTIPAGGFFIITNNASGFESIYGIVANQDIGTDGPADGNGDDDLALINANGEVVDLYGEGGGTDNSGTPWEFEDGRAERIATVTAGNPAGDSAEWNIDNDSGGGDGPQEAPGDYDPGAWIGQPTPTNPYAHVWKLVPEAGALIVSSGENATGSIWWSNSAGDVTTRACLFDDKFVMHADGSFDNDMGTETWLETWQGVDEGCGAPIAPHNNSNDATWSHNEADMTLKLSGVGAYFALAKAYNGGELSGVTDAVPDSRTYDILSFDGNLMTLSIEVGGNYWTFKFVRDGFDPFVDVTFSVDMNEVDTHPDGVYLAGGQFGQDGLLMDDSDGDDIWKVTVELAINQDVNYKFRNQPSFGTWDGFEDANALEPCGVGEYNDRIATIGDQDIELPLVCYGSCYSCDYVPPVSNVTFYLDMNDQTVSDQGVYVAGAIWGEPNDGNQSGRLSDHNGDGVYEGTFEITTGSSIFYTYTNGHSWGNKENIEGQSCANPSNYNDRSMTVTENTNVIAKFQDCDATYSDSVYVEFTVDMGDEVISDAGLFLAGGNYFGGPWEGRFPFTQVDGTTNTWYLADSFPAVLNDAYTYVNGTGWGDKENIQGQDCAFGQYSDREFRTTIVDRQVDHCFGLCGDGTCETIGAPDTATVRFRVDMTGVEEISPDGVHLAGGPFGGPWEDNYRMIDFNHDGVYEIEVDLIDGGTYDYTFTNGMSWDVKENIVGQSCAVEPYSDRRITVDGDGTADHRFGDCDYTYSDSVYVMITLDMGDEVVSDAGLFLAGGNYFGGPWEGRYPFTQVDGSTNTWFLADSFPADLNDAYTYVNGTGWDNKENIQGQECAFGQYNDRAFSTTIVDRSINHCFGLCGEGTCNLIEDNFISLEFDIPQGAAPCEGSIFVTGTFDGWSGAGVELVDDDNDGYYYGSIDLPPGTYQYKYVCEGWSAQEGVPAECGVDNGQGDYNRVIEVSYEDADYYPGDDEYMDYWYIYVDDESWGECPPQDFCDIFDCEDQLHAVLLVDTSEYDFSDMSVRMTGPWWNWDPQGGPVAQWVEFWNPEDAEFFGLGGFFHVALDPTPSDQMEYLWVVNGVQENFLDNENEDLSCIEITDYENYANRLWKPEYCAPDMYEDYDPNLDGCLLVDVYDVPCAFEDDGEEVYFVKENFADPSLPENQDRITDNVWLTRGGAGWLYNAAFENMHSDPSPAGTRWAFGSTDMHHSNGGAYSHLRDVVLDHLGGFTNIVGNTLSLHLIEEDLYFDVTFTSWTPGQSNGGGFGYSRVSVEGPEQLDLTNFTNIDIYDIESYEAGGTPLSNEYNIDGPGLVLTAEFETSTDGTDQYIGSVGVFWDSNFNGVLDENDINVLNDEFNADGPGSVMLIFDNGPDDLNDETGKYAAHIHDLEFLDTQGATFIFAAMNTDGTVHEEVQVSPFNSSAIRFTGTATSSNDVNEPVHGMFVQMSEIMTDDYGFHYYVDAALGVTRADGTYDIGSIDIFVGDSVQLLASSDPQGNSYQGRLVPLINTPGDIGGSYNYATEFHIEDLDAPVFIRDISVIELNTIVQGYAADDMGNPATGTLVWGQMILSDGLNIWNNGQVDQNGYYRFWALNGVELSVWSLFNGQYSSETFMLNATVFDDELDAYVYNYNIEGPSAETARIEGHTYTVDYSNNMYGDTTYLSGVEVTIYNNDDLFTLYTDEGGYFGIDVPASNEGVSYYISVQDPIPGLTNYGFYAEDEVYTGSVFYYNVEYYPVEEYFTISGYVYDDMGNPVYDAHVEINSYDDNYYEGWVEHTFTDYEGYYSMVVPSGLYNMAVYSEGFLNERVYGVDLNADVTIDFTLTPSVMTGSVQGVISFVGEYMPMWSHVNVYSDVYDAHVNADENGFYSVDLVDGVYDIYVDADGYNSFYMSEAFEIAGNTVNFDVELFEYGYAGPPHIMNLHDVPNDQGRQMRAVWDAGMPGDWGYFTQYSIWRKVVNSPIDLWDYIETVPWHGMDPYAAVVPTLGDSSAHGMHMSTFMVTAHTDEVSFWLDSEPMSGYSIDNLHPGAPMSLSFSTGPGSVSLSWSGPVDEDFSYFNVYRQDILTNEPAMVFTTTDSFYIDQAMEDIGAYEYWITAVDLSGLESESSGIVSAVLSSEDEVGMPTEFALKQNYPNPFNPSTQIQYALPSETRVVISIYDITGRKVRTLVNEVQSAGYRTVMWNATNEIGRPVSAGMYIYSIQAGDFIQNRKMVLMK